MIVPPVNSGAWEPLCFSVDVPVSVNGTDVCKANVHMLARGFDDDPDNEIWFDDIAVHRVLTNRVMDRAYINGDVSFEEGGYWNLYVHNGATLAYTSDKTHTGTNSVVFTSAGTDSAALRFDRARRQAWFHDQPLALRPKEYQLLHFLARHRGQVFSREALLSHVWGYESDIEARTVDVHVRRLRAKLAEVAPDTPVILTEWGVGYSLNEDL